MKRVVVGAVGVYLMLAVIGRFVEEMGAVECGCDSSCWCKRPGLSTFRWVFPYGHRGCGLDKPAEVDDIRVDGSAAGSVPSP